MVNLYRGDLSEDMQLRIYSSHKEDWDEIYVVSENTSTGNAWHVVKVAIAKLSEEKRAQLNQHIAMCNQPVKLVDTFKN